MSQNNPSKYARESGKCITQRAMKIERKNKNRTTLVGLNSLEEDNSQENLKSTALRGFCLSPNEESKYKKRYSIKNNILV